MQRNYPNGLGMQILAIGVLVCLAACTARPPQPVGKNEARQPQNRTPANSLERMPDFTIKDTQGHEVSLSSLRGNVMLIDFWATWCGPCKKEMPGYEDLYRRYQKRGLMVVGIAADSDPDAVSRFGKKLRVTYPLLVNGMDVQRYGVLGLPTTILVDRRGFIHKKVVGYEQKKVFEAALIDLLDEDKGAVH
jgi:peroxiredoxin